MDEKCQLFAPFEVKPNMKMAPVVRRRPLHDYALFSEEIEKQVSRRATRNFRRQASSSRKGNSLKPFTEDSVLQIHKRRK